MVPARQSHPRNCRYLSALCRRDRLPGREQAYEFEADKQINVIRFDYDLSELGAYLAGDFLLRDLDTLEHDLIVSQREREQHVRYVLSMGRELPEALQELRDTGRVTFSMVLEQIERRFPGLVLARLGAWSLLGARE